jgi:hypothetical protein
MQRASREDTMRPEYSVEDDFDDRLALPSMEGYGLRWIRFAIRGELDVGNINKRFDREGWVAVKADEVPPKYRIQVGKEGRFEGCVQNGDLILAKLPVERVQALRERNRRRTAMQEDGVRNQLAKANDDPRFPIHDNSRSDVSYGQRRPRIED